MILKLIIKETNICSINLTWSRYNDVVALVINLNYELFYLQVANEGYLVLTWISQLNSLEQEKLYSNFKQVSTLNVYFILFFTNTDKSLEEKVSVTKKVLRNNKWNW